MAHCITPKQVGYDDDSAGNHHARLVISPQHNAQWNVQVSAYGVARTVGSDDTNTATAVRDRTFLGPRSWFGLDFNRADPLRPSSMPVAGAVSLVLVSGAQPVDAVSA